MAGAGCGWSPIPVVPISCGCIWPGWDTRSWGTLSMAMPAVGAPLAACGCMPGDSTWCIPERESPSASRLPCPGKARRRGGGFRSLSADPGVLPRWGPAGPGSRRRGAAGDRREPLPWRGVPVRNGTGWARGSPPGRGGPGPWGGLVLWLSWSVWTWWCGRCPRSGLQWPTVSRRFARCAGLLAGPNGVGCWAMADPGFLGDGSGPAEAQTEDRGWSRFGSAGPDGDSGLIWRAHVEDQPRPLRINQTLHGSCAPVWADRRTAPPRH